MMTDEMKYAASLESVKSWNAKMMMDRKMRQPYLDNTTGLAQTNCHLWMSKLDRNPGLKAGQVYSYPPRKWRKKKRVAPPPAPANGSDPNVITLTAEDFIPSDLEPVVNLNKVGDSSKDKWFSGGPQYEEIDEFDDFEDDFDPYGDDSDFEDSSSKRKRAKKKDSNASATKGSRRSTRGGGHDETEKPHQCELCPARYKTRSGLDYHLSHTHHIGKEDGSSTPVQSQPSMNPPTAAAAEMPNLEMLEGGDSLEATSVATPKQKVKNPVPNDYCDFCLGDAAMNKKSKEPEEMVSCADCGRSGHPTCLQFTENMKVSVRKYPWQCIECKSCGLCGTSENDDQLLFCDDCDRGYHMYCLTPPLSEPPEGNWSCHLCIAEFHGGVKPSWMG